VVLILVICVLCFPMPGGGLLITRLSGTEYVPERAPAEAMPVEAMPVEAPVIAVAPSPPPVVVEAAPRFTQGLDLFPEYDDPLAAPQPPWVEVARDGKTIWIDNASKMAWGPRLDVELSGMSQEDLDLARSFCEKEKPVGAWALPTAAEFDIAKVNGILKADSGAKHKWITWQQVPPALVIPSGRGYMPASPNEGFSVRCIARTLGAPENGYLQTDNETTLKAMSE